jgi:twitching motility protein PilT
MHFSQINTAPIEDLLRELWERGGTDIHIVADAPPMFRIDGELHPFPEARVLSPDDLETLASALLPADLQAQYERDRQVDFSFSWGTDARFRGNAFRERGSVAIALRSIPYQIPTPDELLLPPILSDLTRRKQGLVLVTGPTGSGKSTTQASLIGLINRTQARHVLTLEDPIEYVHNHDRSVIAQREVGLDVPTFQAGLRGALREDPDIVLVGEMRDPESIATTLTVAETGHLVFATLHTNDASTAIDRIIDIFPPERQSQIRIQLAASLQAVVAQRLIPRVGGGLIAAFEILLANSAVRGLIREGKTHQVRNVIAQSVRDGMQTLEQSLSALASHGLISDEEAIAAAVLPKELRLSGPSAAPAPVAS